MPTAHGAVVKYWLQDHDTAYLDTTPVQNTWYTILDEDDVRLIYHAFAIKNDEATGGNVEIRWTLDTNIYVGPFIELADNTQYYVYRTKYSIAEVIDPLTYSTDPTPCMFFEAKHALHGKLEARITTAVGTNPHLYQWCLYETAELT